MNLLLEIEAGAGPGRLVRAESRETAALVARGNPLDSGWSSSADDAGALPLVLWSGSLGSGLFDAHPHTWGAPGWERLEEVCRALEPDLRARKAIACFRPHARHVLSDAPSCLRFVREHGDGPFGLALDPGRCLEPSMLPVVEDHLERLFSLVAGYARFLFLADVRPTEDGASCEPVPLGQGVLPRDCVLAMMKQHVPAVTPIVLIDEDLAGQRGWLGV